MRIVVISDSPSIVADAEEIVDARRVEASRLLAKSDFGKFKSRNRVMCTYPEINGIGNSQVGGKPELSFSLRRRGGGARCAGAGYLPGDQGIAFRGSIVTQTSWPSAEHVRDLNARPFSGPMQASASADSAIIRWRFSGSRWHSCAERPGLSLMWEQ